jgi:hypothetical protein
MAVARAGLIEADWAKAEALTTAVSTAPTESDFRTHLIASQKPPDESTLRDESGPDFITLPIITAINTSRLRGPFFLRSKIKAREWADVRYWHKADIKRPAVNVRFRG